MHSPRRMTGPIAAAVVAMAALGFVVGIAGSAQAASCAKISITPGVQSPALSPKSATINVGGCASYTNNTALPVKVTVGKLSTVTNPNGVAIFVERAAGTFAVTAQEQFQGQGVGGNGTGTLVVRRAPAPKPSSHPSTTAHPSASPSSSAQPSATPSSSGPVVAPTTTPPGLPSHPPSVTPAPNESGQGNPPIIQGIPTTTPTPSAPEVVGRAQLQPPSGRAAGLPAAVAAFLVVGAGAAFVRVLLAEPAAVDGRFAVPRAS